MRTPTVSAPAPSRTQRLAAWTASCYHEASSKSWFQTAIVGIFFSFAAINLASVVIIVVLLVHYYLPIDLVVTGSVPQIAQQISQLLSIALICMGLQYVWRRQRVQGYRMLERAVLVQLSLPKLP